MRLRKVALTAAVIATTLTPTMTLAQHGHWGGGGGWHGGGWHGGWGHGGWGNAWGWGLAGLAAGTLIGGALAARPYGYGYGYAPGYGYGYGYAPGVAYAGAGVGYCERRFRSYDPASGTYLGYDGVRHPCP